MKPPFLKVLLLVLSGCISTSFSAPIEDKQSTGCNKAKGAVRSSVETTDTDINVNLLADLDALANGKKRSGIEKGCHENSDKKSKTDPITEGSAGNVPGNKRQTLNVIKEASIVNEDDIDKMPIIETGKAAIRSSITNETQIQSESKNSTSANATAGSSSINVASNNATAEAKQASNSTNLVQGTAAKTFISTKAVNVNPDKRSGSATRKGKVKAVKTKNAMKKSVGATHGSLHDSKVQDEAPSMQKGSLSKETDTQEKATAKSSSNILSPLTSAIKSLDSASKLLGMATASKNTAAASVSKDTDKKATGATTDKVTTDQTAALKPSSLSNTTSPDVSSTARSASSSKSTGKESAANPPVAKAPSKAAAASVSADPYAEIASGPDSPKMPDLKTGSDKAGLPVMKVDPNSPAPEPVSFAKGAPEPEAPRPVPESSSSSRAGPQDVGGILDQLTDKLNKGGVAPENPLPPQEAKSITDRLTEYDHDALETAKGWESTGLKAIEKLKSAEFSHGSMKNELSKELTDRLGGEGYGAALGANLEGGPPSAEVSNLDTPSQTSYSQPPQQSYGRQQASQWPEFNSMENLDSEAQREEQAYGGQYSEARQGNYGDGNEAMMSSEQNSYDRQDIPAFLQQGLVRDSVDNVPEQGQYYKRNIILKPLYYYYDHHLPYGFKHPYDD